MQKKCGIFLLMILALSASIFVYRYIDLQYKAVGWGGPISFVLNRSIMKGWNDQIESFNPAVGGHQFCERVVGEKWYNRPMSECRVLHNWGDWKPCGFWFYAFSCAAIAIPADYAEDKAFMRILQQSTLFPCRFIIDIERRLGQKIDQNQMVYLKRRFGCQNGEVFRRYSMAIILLNLRSQYQERKSNSSPVGYYYLSSRSKVMKYYDW